MNALEIVQLAKSKAAHELTVEEVLLIREAVADTPELYHLLGGEEEFERYMADAPEVTATGQSPRKIAATESEDEEAEESSRGNPRRLLWLGAGLIVLLAAVAGGWKFLARPGPVPSENGLRITSAARPGTNSSNRAHRESPTTPGAEKASPADVPDPDPDPEEERLLKPRPPTFPLFEDEGRFAAIDEPRAGEELVAALIDDDKYSGRRSVRLLPGKRHRLKLAQSLPIRANPGDGEYRQLRFAFRKFGSGRLCLELEREDEDAPPIRYDAGQGPPSHGGAHRVWGLELPGEWIVMTCDVFRDYGPGEVTALTLSVLDGGPALFDHVWLAQDVEGLDGIAGAPSVEATNQRARRVLAKNALSVASPAAVRLEANGRHATGVLIGDQGHVLTCAHLLLALETDITVRFADGRTVKGRKAGICREADCGVIQLIENLGRKGLEFSDLDAHTPQDLHVAFSVTPRFNNGNAPASYLVETEPDVDKRILWTDFEMEGAELGGPLVDRSGKAVGIHVRTTEEGRMGFAKLTEVRTAWERLKRGESVGRWLPGTGPMIGVVSTAIGEGSRIDRVLPGAPAELAGLRVGDVIVEADGQAVRSYLDIGRQLAGYDPGDTVGFLIQRDGMPHSKSIRLMPRQKIAP